ncbi:MAG: amidohydrolase family protein [Candidatus Sumerlaeota bacterium]|nr:amidohydrolase family protein [Candidatus Sumerlaeota bacterium]
MSIWDGHHHFISEEGYVDRLLRAMDRLGIERTGLMPIDPISPGMWVAHGKPVGFIGNAELARIVKRHKDRFWGYGYLRPGRAQPDEVDQLADWGMTGLKFHLPVTPYGDPEHFPIYARADALRMPCLFHTGIFAPPVPMPGQGVRSENCRPIHLEPIAWEFPNLPLIAAHLGVCWTDEAATLCRIIPNIYADISGSSKGWRFNKPMEWFRQTLYWEDAHRKIVFGSDVHADELESALNDQKRIIQGMGWNEVESRNFFSDNLRRLFNHK